MAIISCNISIVDCRHNLIPWRNSSFTFYAGLMPSYQVQGDSTHLPSAVLLILAFNSLPASDNLSSSDDLSNQFGLRDQTRHNVTVRSDLGPNCCKMLVLKTVSRR